MQNIFRTFIASQWCLKSTCPSMCYVLQCAAWRLVLCFGCSSPPWCEYCSSQTRHLILLLHICFFIFVPATTKQLGQGVPDSTQEQCTEQVLKWHEWIMDSQQKWRQLEVDKEYYNSKVHQSMWCWDKVSLLIQDKYNRCNYAGFCWKTWLHEFHCCWCPNSPD